MNEKLLPMEAIFRDQGVSELFVKDKMVRQATHALLRAVITQLEGLFPDPLARGKLSPDVRVQAHGSPADKTITEDGKLKVVNDRTGLKQDVFPHDFSLDNHLVLTHTVDRGSTGGALLFFMISQGYLWTVAWGFFHDMWNSIKNAAKKTANGKWWKTILQFASVANLNHGPFRSGAWGKSKQIFHKRYMESHTSDSLDFVEAAKKTAYLAGLDATDLDYDYWFNVMGRLPSCTEAGPVCKFARWHSIEQCWKYYRHEMWFLKEVLLSMDPQEAQKHVASASTQMVDAELAEKLTTDKGGLVVRAPSYITQNLIDSMDMFAAVTDPLKTYSSSKAENVKTVEANIENQHELMAGGWEDQFIDIIRAAFFDLHLLLNLDADVGDQRSADNIAELAAFALQLMTERAIRVLPELFQHPACSVQALHPDPQVAKNAVREFSDHLRILLDAEHKFLAGIDLGLKNILADIVWKDNQTVRLFLHLCASDVESSSYDASTRMARAMHSKLGDEKAPEDIHQHVRDAQRCRRHKVLTGVAIHHTQLLSGVLQSRNLQVQQVPIEAVANECWRSQRFNSKTRQHKYNAAPKYFPKELNALLDGRNKWPAATVEQRAQSYLAWAWLKGWGTRPPAEVPESPWSSRLVPAHWALRVRSTQQVYMNLYAGRHGCIVLKLLTASEGSWKLVSDRGLIEVLHIVNPQDYDLLPTRAVVNMSTGIIFEQHKDSTTILKKALEDTRDFEKYEMLQALKYVKPDDDIDHSELKRQKKEHILEFLIDHVFVGNPEKQTEIKNAYKNPTKKLKNQS